MRRLSASSTFFYKRVFPLCWFGFVLLVLAAGWAGLHRVAAFDAGALLPLLAGPLLLGIVGLVLFKTLLYDLVDEVWLDGDTLLVKNRGQQARLALADVVNVNATTLTNPRRITVMLRTDSRFGRNVSFIPAGPRGLMAAFRPDPIASELIDRVDALRQGRR